MIKTTRPFRSSLLACLFCGASAASLLAQAPADQPPGDGHHHGLRPDVLFESLDSNHDGILSAEEIANAPAVLKGLLKSGETQLTRADLRPGNKDEPMPPERAAREDSRQPNPPAENNQTAGRGPDAPSTRNTEPADHPHDRRRFAVDDQGMRSNWRHHFQRDEAERPWQRPARAQHEEMEDHQRPEYEFDDQPDEPRHPHFYQPRRFEAQETDQDGMGSGAEIGHVLAVLHRLEREVHQLEEKQGTPGLTQP